ncbi:acetate--CoA ligase [Candidatus Dojkabacteria bacterium]|uniref:Acetate--CoA ligase n=1 Tax=Candidatus Dojkabacteria bacterium TaxID=2099670 RepID=A0A955RK40_9BACT|nr:acetate--CoA ligase [Candidatus Dojkabacteria bacterium]
MTTQITSFTDYKNIFDQSIQSPEKFWAKEAQTFEWHSIWDTVLDYDFDTPSISWFVNGKLNITVNCLDRHLPEHSNRVAYTWIPNNPDEISRSYTYQELYDLVCKCANALKSYNITKGDRVCIYMPMIPEAVIAMLACARIGAVHTVVFAGFSSEALVNRIIDAEAKLVITTDGAFRGPGEIPLKEMVDTALSSKTTTVEHVIVYKRTNSEVTMTPKRDIFWDSFMDNQPAECPPEIMDSEDPLFILYTSGSTGKPKGIVHTCGGYMVYTEYSFRNVFHYEPHDTYWCTADIGWITGHSYIVYGPLLAGAQSILFEGVPTYPDPGRFWNICQDYKVTQFYTSPTAIRKLESFGDEYVKSYDLTSLKTLGSVGEPINKDAWEWYFTIVGGGNCQIVDTWWQTETGGILISSLSQVTPSKAGYAAYPLPGIMPIILDENGAEITTPNTEGFLCIAHPWPSMLRTIHNDHQRFQRTYFSRFKGTYFTGDSAKLSPDGLLKIIGRVDDVINVSGHRLGTAEIEEALNSHPDISESAVIGYPHSIKGEGIYAFVKCIEDTHSEENLISELTNHIALVIGKIARPDKIQIVPDLPKTRSGKIMRRILRKLAMGEKDSLGDTSTLVNPEIIESLSRGIIPA